MSETDHQDHSDMAWNAFVTAAKEFAPHLDQWEKIKFDTPYGMVYVSISRAAEWPEDYHHVK